MTRSGIILLFFVWVFMVAQSLAIDGRFDQLDERLDRVIELLELLEESYESS